MMRRYKMFTTNTSRTSTEQNRQAGCLMHVRANGEKEEIENAGQAPRKPRTMYHLYSNGHHTPKY